MSNGLVGRTIGNYVVQTKVGEGGMGVVYLAEHPRIHRKVAIKVLHPDAQRQPDAAARFLTEARASSEIDSEHVIDIIDFGELESGEPYLTMEWLDGQSLAALVEREGRFPVARAIHVLEGIGRALSAAHARGVIHRDLKPDNVFLVTRDGKRDFVKVLDFGIAKIARSDSGSNFRTQTGAILGTPAYMSPEQCKGAGEIDHRSDLYSLGVIAYQLLSGQLPFVREGWGQILLAHMTEMPRPLSEWDATLPPPVSDAVMRVLSKSPDDRFPSAEAFLEALTGQKAESFRTSRTMTAAPVVQQATMLLPKHPTTLRSATGEVAVSDLETDIVEGPRRTKKSSGLVPLALGALVVVGGGGAFFALRGGPKPAPAPESPAVPTAAAVAPKPEPPPPPEPPKAERKTVRVRIAVTPASATVTLDGAKISNPSDLPMEPDGRSRLLVADAPGFKEERSWVVVDKDVDLKLELRRSTDAGKAGAKWRRLSGGDQPASPEAAPAPTPAAPSASVPAAPGMDRDEIVKQRARLKIQTEFPQKW